MITQLQIKNFKGWQDTGILKLAPITVFFGTNSSGKSSIGQFLMMLKQTANSPDRSRVLHPGDETTDVDLGTLEDIVHRHEISRELGFSIAWKRNNPLSITDPLTKKSVDSREIEFSSRIAFQQSKGIKATSREFNYRFLDNENEPFSAGMSAAPTTGKFKLDTTGFTPIRKQGRVWDLPNPTRFFGFPDELSFYFQNAETLNDLAFDFQNLLQGISYLGPLREEPRRHYQWAGESPQDVGTRGERWVSALLSGGERKISGGYRKPGKPLEVLIATWLKDLGLIEKFTIRPIMEGAREYRVRLQVHAGSAEVSIPDVGFGISQVLPVLVQAFYAPQNSTVIIEQPELHLHPAIQQNLADLFIGAAKARENGNDRNVQFLIESHSEHFLRRLQRRIADKSINHSDIAAYFVDTHAGASRITELDVDLYGNIRNWPNDFFGDQMVDVAEMQKAAIQRRKNS